MAKTVYVLLEEIKDEDSSVSVWTTHNGAREAAKVIRKESDRKWAVVESNRWYDPVDGWTLTIYERTTDGKQ